MNDTLQVLVCFTAHEEWYGKLIRRVLSYPYNHTLIMFKSPFWDAWRATDVLYKVTTIPAEEAAKRYSKIEYYKCQMDLLPGLRAVHSYTGADFDFKGLLWGLWRTILWKWFNVKIIKPFHATSKVFCSEFVATILKEAGVPGAENWEPSNISPADLRRFVLSCGVFTRVDGPV